MLSREKALEHVSYDPATGTFTRLKSVHPGRVGKPTGFVAHGGYIVVVIGSSRHYAHRLAWLIMTGEQPKVVDHINRDPSDNRWANLRNGTQAQNTANAGPSKNNKTGFKGVSFQRGRYRATLMYQRKQISLGAYATAEEASNAYKAKAHELWGDYASI
jgi:hypothetical protein